MRDLTDTLNYAKESAGAMVGQSQARRDDVTLRENIDRQIADAEARVTELKATKDRLMTSGILDTRIDDLSRAMRY